MGRGSRKLPPSTLVSSVAVKPATPRGKRGEACTRMRVEIHEFSFPAFRRGPGEIAIDATAYDSNNNRLGTIIAEGRGQRLSVSSAEVSKPRCGVGTRLYEALAKLACDRGLEFTSDTILSPASRAFWQKQVDKGRAKFDKKRKRYVLRDSCTTSLEGTKEITMAKKTRRKPRRRARGLDSVSRFRGDNSGTWSESIADAQRALKSNRCALARGHLVDAAKLTKNLSQHRAIEKVNKRVLACEDARR